MKVPTALVVSSVGLAFGLALSLQAVSEVRGRSPVAKAICSDIVSDNSNKLDRHLRVYRRSSVILSRYYGPKSPKLHNDFRCNNMRLIEFAGHIGSIQVEEYLWKKENRGYRVSVEEVAAN